jgi:putative nucleotidyltransferase with HDIG domain
MDPEIFTQIIQGFAGALKGLRLYPPGHPLIARQVQNLSMGLRSLFRSRKILRMGLLEGTLFFEEHLFFQGGPASDEIANLLASHEIEGVEFQAGLPPEELVAFLDVLLAAEAKGEAFGEVLVDRNISHIRPVAVQTEETDTSEKRPRKVYGRALQVVDSIFRDVRLGKIPSSAEAMDVVKSMVQLTLAEPHALFALSMLKDYDNYTFTHSVNVSVIALAVGRACSLSEEKLRMLGLGGLLHDLGKLKIAREIITKPGRLNEEEFAEIRKHPGTGAEIAAAMEGVTEEVVQIVLGHHLGFDDRGYPPEARTGEKSPLVNMVAIADTYDAITTLRSYQRPVTPRRAVACLREISGTALHPEITERFIASLGTYPVGSLVRLDNNEIGLVVWVDTKDPDSVRLKILFDENGRRLEVPLRLDLPGPEAGRIVAEVDPFIKGVEVTDYFD